MIDNFDNITTQMSPSMRGEVEFKVVDELTGEEIYSHKQSNMWFDQGLTNFINGLGASMILVNDEVTEYTYRTTAIDVGRVTSTTPSRTWESAYNRHKFGGVFASANRTFNRIGLAASSTGTSAYCCTTLTEPYTQLEGQILYVYYYVYVDVGFSTGISSYEVDRWKEFVPFQTKNSVYNGQNDYYTLCRDNILTVLNTKNRGELLGYYGYTGDCINLSSNWSDPTISPTKYRRHVKNQSLGDSGSLSSYAYSAITGIGVYNWGGWTKFKGKYAGRTWIKNRWSSAAYFDSSLEAIPSGWWQAVDLRSTTSDDFSWKASNKISIYPIDGGDITNSSYVYGQSGAYDFMLAESGSSNYHNNGTRNLETMVRFGRKLLVRGSSSTYKYAPPSGLLMYDLDSDEYNNIGDVNRGGYVIHDDITDYVCQVHEGHPYYNSRYLVEIFEFDDVNNMYSDYTTYEVDTPDQRDVYHAQMIDYNGSPKILTQLDSSSPQYKMLDMTTKLWEDWWITDFGKQLGTNVQSNTNVVWGNYNKSTDSFILVSDDCTQIMSIDGLTDVNNVVVDGVTGDVDIYSSYRCWSKTRQLNGSKYVKGVDSLKLSSCSRLLSSTGGFLDSSSTLYGFMIEDGEFDIEIELDNIKPFLSGQSIGLSVMDTSDIYDESPILSGHLPGRYIGFTTSSDVDSVEWAGNVDNITSTYVLESFDINPVTGSSFSDGDVIDVNNPNEASWTYDSGVMTGTEIKLYNSWSTPQWQMGVDGERTYIQNNVTSLYHYDVYDYSYVEIEFPPSEEFRFFSYDYKHNILDSGNDDNNYAYTYVQGVSRFSWRPLYNDTVWHTSPYIGIPPNVTNIRIVYRTENDNNTEIDSYIAYSNFTFHETDIHSFDYDSINEDISTYDFNVESYDISNVDPYDTINPTSTTLVHVTDIDETKPHGKLKVVRNALNEIQTYYATWNGVSWSVWIELNSGISSNVITGNAYVALYMKNGDGNLKSFTTDLLNYTINSGTIDRKVLALPKMVEITDEHIHDYGVFGDAYSTSKDGMACYTDKNEIYVLYRYMCRVYDATTFELKRNEVFLPETNSFNGLPRDYNEGYIKFDDFDLTGDALGGIVLYANNYPRRFYTSGYTDNTKRSNKHVRDDQAYHYIQSLFKIFTIDPVNGSVVDTSYNIPTYSPYNSQEDTLDNYSAAIPYKKGWIMMHGVCWSSTTTITENFRTMTNFKFSWDSGLSKWVLRPTYGLNSKNYDTLLDTRIRDDVDYDMTSLITPKPSHADFQELHPFSADIQVRFNELSSSPSNTLSPDDYYTTYFTQDGISKDNQQYITGFSHIMYWTRAERHNDVFTPAATHEVSETADIKFHSIDNGDPLMYKFFYKDNITDRHKYFDVVVEFDAGDTITTTDGGITLKIENDLLDPTYDIYKGKHLRYLGETRTILEYDHFYKTFVLDSAFTLTPTTGNGVELVVEQPATLVTEFVGDNEFMLDDETGIITPSPDGVSHKVDFTYIAIYRTW